MNGPREMKRWIAKMRRDHGKKNGVICSGLFDDLWLFKLETDKKYRKTKRRHRDGSGKHKSQIEGEVYT